MISTAEKILLEKVKENKNKTRYVKSKISDSIHEFKQIIKSDINSRLKENLLRLLHESKLDEIDNSMLIGEENSYLKNAIYAHYKNFKEQIQK